MKDLQNKHVVVAGSLGLIGRAVVAWLKIYGAVVKTIDIGWRGYPVLDYDVLVDNFCHDVKDWEPEPDDQIDVFINTTYPEQYHIESFLMPTIRVAETMSASRKGGSIINMSSIYGIVGPDVLMYRDTKVKIPPIEYSMAKGAIQSFSRNLATRYAPYNVRINCVCAGGVYDNQDEIFVERYCAKTPMGRMATPGDIANVILFLASDMSSYITGQNIVVDGGYSIV